MFPLFLYVSLPPRQAWKLLQDILEQGRDKVYKVI